MVYITINIFGISDAHSEMVCALDFDGIGGIDQNEIQTCHISENGNSVCPIQMLECITPQPTTTEKIEKQIDVVVSEIEQSDIYCPSGDDNPCNIIDGKSYCSVNQCADNESDLVTEIDDILNESDTTIPLNEDGQCTGDIKIFPGLKTSCRKAGTQTRWDNCCNNGEKIIEDSFNNPVDNSISAYSAIAGIIDGVLGSSFEGATGDIDNIVSATPGYHVIEGTVEAANWVFSPCASDSISTSLIESGFCAYIGTRCTESWKLGFESVCVQRAEVHCCFNSLMAKMVHVQGRSQLPDMGWGSTETPNCSGFKIEQFQSLDFSKFDFTEYESEIRKRSEEEIRVITDELSSDLDTEYGDQQ